jgi:hypothetical protein
MTNSKSLAAGITAILFMISGVFYALKAQEIRSNEKGEKVIVNPDGSWRYFNISGPTDEVFLSARKGLNFQELSAKYPVFKGEISPMDLAFAIPEYYARSIAIRKSQVAADARAIAQKRAFVAQLQREKVERDLAALKKTNAPEADIRFLNYKLISARTLESESQFEAIAASEAVSAAEVLTPKGVYLNKIRSEQRRQTGNRRNIPEVFYTLQDADFLAGLVLNGSEENASLPTPDELWNVPSPDCTLQFESMDPLLQQPKREVQKQTLFTYTDQRLRPILKEKEYLHCEGNLSTIGDQKMISLEFTFAYPNSREAYGIIEKGSMLTIKLLNGDYVNLRSGVMDRGSYNTTTNLLTYNVHYPLDENQVSLLRYNEVDSILVFWSSGFEEYEVFEVDFFITQLACLEK